MKRIKEKRPDFCQRAFAVIQAATDESNPEEPTEGKPLRAGKPPAQKRKAIGHPA